MSPVKATTGPPGPKGHGRRSSGEKWLLSTPFGTTTALSCVHGISCWKACASAGETNRQWSHRASAARSNARNRSRSRRYSQDQRPAPVCSHLAPFVGVDVDEVDDAPHAASRAARQELRHRRRIGENAPDRPTLHQVACPSGERRVVEDCGAQGLVAQQGAPRAQPDPRSGQSGEVAFARTGFADGPRGASRRDRRRSIPDGRRGGARGVPGSDRRGSCRPWWAGRGCDARETGSPPIGSPEAAGDQRAERIREGQRQAPPERDPKGVLGIERVHIGQL